MFVCTFSKLLSLYVELNLFYYTLYWLEDHCTEFLSALTSLSCLPKFISLLHSVLREDREGNSAEIKMFELEWQKLPAYEFQ